MAELASFIFATDDGHFILADVRHALAVQAGQAVSLPGEDAARSLRLVPHPSLDLRAELMACSPCGYFVAVAGRLASDPDQWRVVVLRVAGVSLRGRPGPAPVEVVELDAELFADRPGLRVLQLDWHPGSELHLATLTSDSTWRLYSIQQPEVAEQTFELSLGRGALGLTDSLSSRAPTAFAFGPTDGWDALSVYFLDSRGDAYRLCPVVPSGARLPAAVWCVLDAARRAGEGEDGAEAAADDRSVAVSWLQQAFDEQGRAMPLALQGHVPALVGPLPSDPSPEASWAAEQRAEALALVRYAPGCTAVVAAGSAGSVVAGVLLAPASPAWQEGRPQALLAERPGRVLATRYQVGPPRRPEGAPVVGILDLFRLPAAPETAAEDDDNPGRSVRILPDPAAPEQFYVLHRRGCHALRLRWLPGLAAGEPTSVRPAATCLLDASATGLTDGCVVGDALSGTALFLIPAEGDAQVSLLRADDAEEDEAEGASDAPAPPEHVESELEALCTPPRTPPRSSALGTEEQRLATEAAALRESLVEYAHCTHHDINQHLKTLETEAGAQRSALGRAQETLRAAESRAGALQTQLDAALRLQDLLNERCALLGGLYRELGVGEALPQGQTRFLSRDLPRLEAESRAAKGAAEALLVRVAAVTRQGRSLGQAAAAKASLDQPLSADALHQLRRALVKQETRIGRAVNDLAQLEAALVE
ncbi:hypothetical protein QBZ16_001443 [Prototheca wickerhamii]|uniref:Nuclear pore complex protein Nup88 n=1 Tax=Prototheca wickerhamii TaxID=3111 RepID=A0AAD9IH94_PROWI|nr:hypothetical protein QBZ16_001443 [Prototheca wickerhamii]